MSESEAHRRAAAKTKEDGRESKMMDTVQKRGRGRPRDPNSKRSRGVDRNLHPHVAILLTTEIIDGLALLSGSLIKKPARAVLIRRMITKGLLAKGDDGASRYILPERPELEFETRRHVTMRMPAVMSHAVSVLALETGRSRSSLIRDMVRDGLAKRKAYPRKRRKDAPLTVVAPSVQ